MPSSQASNIQLCACHLATNAADTAALCTHFTANLTAATSTCLQLQVNCKVQMWCQPKL